MENFFIRELAVAFLWWIYPQWLKKRWNAISEWLKIGSSSRVETWSRRWRRPKRQFFIAIRGLHNCHGWWLLSDQSTAPYVVKYWTPSEQLLAFNSLIRNYNVKKRKRNQSHPKSIQTKTTQRLTLKADDQTFGFIFAWNSAYIICSYAF